MPPQHRRGAAVTAPVPVRRFGAAPDFGLDVAQQLGYEVEEQSDPRRAPLIRTKQHVHRRTAFDLPIQQHRDQATGQQMVETPEGKMIGRAGGSHVIVPGGPPMHLTATGTETRRALVLILHDSAQPPTTPARDWTPKGLCKS